MSPGPHLGGFAAALFLGGSLTLPESSGPPAARTGGFGEASCVECHIGNDVNAYGGRVSIEGLPEAYRPGERYVLTVLLEAEETEVAGFQLAARFALSGAGPTALGPREPGANAGRVEPTDGRTAVADSMGISYLQQTEVGSGPFRSDRASWSFAWTAPLDGGPVVWHVAANSGNGDESPLGDLVFLAEHVVPDALAPGSAPR